MRSPNWHENEIMLALDLYLSRDLQWINRISDSTFEIIALSQILNALDFYDESPFEIYGIDYCVNKEWYENQRFRYLRWLSLVDIKPFYMIKKEKFQAVLNFIKKLDSQKVSFTKMEILAEFSEEVEMEEVISILIQKGVLVGFQGSTKEFVIDDYDMLFRMLNNPQDYARE